MLTIYTSNSAKNLISLSGKNLIYWPEIEYDCDLESSCSLHPQEIEKECEKLLDNHNFRMTTYSEQNPIRNMDIVTLNGIVILFFLRAVRKGFISPENLKIIYRFENREFEWDGIEEITIGVDDKGELLQPWPDEMFDITYHLRFS
jgi:hypothetical protein